MIAIATILLSLTAFMPMSNAAPSVNVTQPNLDKLAPNLKAKIEADPTGDNRIIVVLKTGVSKASALNRITSLGGTVNGQYNIINAISVTISADKIPVLTSLVDVDKVLVDGKKYLPPTLQGDDSGAAINNLIQYGEWYAQFPFWIGADQAWQMGIDGTGVIVADLDTGIFYEHPDLDGVVIDYKVFTGEVDAFPHDGSGHGTATTGCVAAQGLVDWFGGDPFPFRIKGVAPGAKVIGGKVMTDEGWGWDSWIIAGIEWAVTRGANIITMSLGGLEVPNDGYDPMCLALEAATQQGVTCFVAAGNDQGTGTVQSGGVAHDVITVGASTEGAESYWLFGYWPYDPATGYENDQMIFWSGGGPTADSRLDPDICAIGAWGTSLDTYPNYVWVQFGGTSMATPVAAGAGALVLQAYKQAHGVFPSPSLTRKILMNTAKDIGYPANRQGAGRVDALKAVKAALSQADYSDTDEINKMLPARSCDTTWSVFTNKVDSAYATKLQMFDSMSFSLSVPNGDTYVPIAIPAGTEFADVRVKFAPEVAYGTPIHSYDGTTWTDIHLNTALYSTPTEDDLILINYAYAHTNVQWFDARVAPGDYALRFWNQYATVDPVDVQINFYKFVPWTWVSTAINGKKLQTKMTVPSSAAPGVYSGFVRAICGGSLVDIPIVITVPAKLGQTFTVQTNIMNEPRDFASGDWIYIPVKACIIGNLMLTVSWTTPDADFDVYLINPAGEARAESVAPSAIVLPKPNNQGGGRMWYTTTGTTMEMLSTLCLFPGYWYVGIHAMYFGNTFGQTVTVNLDQGKPINAPSFLNLKKGTSKTFTVSNNIPGAVNVQTMALSQQMEQYAWAPITGTVYSFDGTNQGWEGWNLRVTPDMVTFTVTLNWVGSLKMGLSLWDPAGRNVAVANTNGGSITVNNPAVGWWGAIITIDETGSQDYTLTVSGLRFKALNGVTITPATFTLPAMGTQTVTISATPQASGAGVIVYYDLATGSTYARTLLTITR
jgi:subtilisin family serine protease